MRFHRLPLPAAAAMLVFSLAACSGAATLSATASPSPASDPLAGTRWALLSVADQPVPAGISATLAFDAGQASGSGGCNTFTGEYKVARPDSIHIGPLASTRKACPAPVADFEATYLAALQGVTTWAVPADAPIGTQLTLGGGPVPKLVFGKPAGG
jgi:heat shock protein HslJ